MSSRPRLGAVPALVLSMVAAPVAAGEPLMAVREGDRWVFTNVPSREARPVPGVTRGPVVAAVRLPSSLYDPFIEQVARENGISPKLVKAVAVVESGLDPHAVSVKGAQGLMQLMPATAKAYGVTDPFDPLQNLSAGTRHLRDLLDRFDGDTTLALAAYNAGSGAVQRAGGVPNYPETLEYLRRIEARLGRSGPGSRSRVVTPPSSPVRFQRMPDGSVLLAN